MYINTIAKIVHSDTHAYYGAANKNTGSAFLLCWKICDGMLPGLRDPRDPPQGQGGLVVDKRGMRRRGSALKPQKLLGAGANELGDTEATFKARAREGVHSIGTGAGLKSRKIRPTEMVESALCAFIKIQVDLHHANQRSLLEFTQSDGIIRRFGPGYRVAMTFGMHVGWAVEGAIGSRFKIDASYLSPNVNLAARLQAATSQIGVTLLLSEVSRRCRRAAAALPLPPRCRCNAPRPAACAPPSLAHPPTRPARRPALLAALPCSQWFVDELGEHARSMCRRIDRVTVKGSETPMDLYTWDIVNFPDHRALVPKVRVRARLRTAAAPFVPPPRCPAAPPPRRSIAAPAH